MTLQEVKNYMYHGPEGKEDGNKRLDWALSYAFDQLDGLFDRENFERAFWNRVTELANRNCLEERKRTWDEACEAQKIICSDLLNNWEFGRASGVHHFKDAPKPKFKP